MPRGSAAYVLAIVSVLTGIIGAGIYTFLDPIQQNLFRSTLFSTSTTYGADALSWQMSAWTYWPVIILLGIMMTVWIDTRRAA